MSTALETFVIVGAGQAGAWIARTLRAEGFGGRVVLIGDETHAPYARPPLSKAILAGEDNPPDLFVLTRRTAADIGIEIRSNTEVLRVDPNSRQVHCSGGMFLHYDKLFLATGSSAAVPQWAPGTTHPRAHTLRTLDDAKRLRADFSPGSDLVAIGGGWIGLEVAAAARAMGMNVTVIERGYRLCARSMPPVVSQWLLTLHSAHGVRCIFGANVSGYKPYGDRMVINLADGRRVEGSLCLVGIGNKPNVKLAVQAGLKVDDGIVVDEEGRTSDPYIFAAGDVTNQPCSLTKSRVRYESWANAQNQAIATAKTALGIGAPYRDPPWLWSDQYDCNIQILGRPEHGVRCVTRGLPNKRAGSWLSLDAENNPVGLVSINDPRHQRSVRKSLMGGTPLDIDLWMAGE
jgi:3-phenylpropionate/trans-cinnamate dioxygenase ferredoxin reductase subunit